MEKTIYLAWQDSDSRRWFPIGRLRSNGKRFVFVYTGGALVAQRAGFSTLAAFPKLDSVYESDKLFPLFANRLLRASRPDFRQYLNWLSVPESDPDPLLILARSGGQRVTDTMDVFPYPDHLEDGVYETHFLVHGLSHMTAESCERASLLQPGESLSLMWDFQNRFDPNALALRTAETYKQDMFLVGYCPRFLSGDILKLMDKPGNSPMIVVERVNPPPAPFQFRILCKLRMKWPAGFMPFSGPEYQPLLADLDMQERVA